MKIGELAKAAGVSKDTIRYYVEAGLLIPGRNPDNGYQVFPTSAVARLRFIKQAQRLGFRLEDIRLIFHDAENEQSPCPRVRDVIVERIVDMRRQIAELTVSCENMEMAVQHWETMPNGTPTGTSICRLIESEFGSRSEDSHCFMATRSELQESAAEAL